MKLLPLYLLAMTASLLSTGALGQPNNLVHIRATIEAVHGQMLDLTSRTGDKMQVSIGTHPTVAALVPSKLTELKPGSYIGTTAIPQPDGTLKAVEVHVFPERLRGAGEGSRPWDLEPQSSMTNGTVDGDVVGTSGQAVTVRYGTGEKRIEVPTGTPIVTYEAGDPSMLKPGVHVFIIATRAANGALSASRVTVGKDGLIPPM